MAGDKLELRSGEARSSRELLCSGVTGRSANEKELLSGAAMRVSKVLTVDTGSGLV